MFCCSIEVNNIAVMLYLGLLRFSKFDAVLFYDLLFGSIGYSDCTEFGF